MLTSVVNLPVEAQIWTQDVAIRRLMCYLLSYTGPQTFTINVYIYIYITLSYSVVLLNQLFIGMLVNCKRSWYLLQRMIEKSLLHVYTVELFSKIKPTWISCENKQTDSFNHFGTEEPISLFWLLWILPFKIPPI